jgi:hypothetical protein
MTYTGFEAVVAALHEAGVRYLVAGGLAVSVHGYVRFTKDVDVVLQLDPANVVAAFAALEKAGYRPSVPVSANDFADPATRERWIREKGMKVLNFWSDSHRQTPVDVFVIEPFPFEEECSRAAVRTFGSVPVRFVSIEALIRMKEAVGRTQDKIDVEYLRKLLDARG